MKIILKKDVHGLGYKDEVLTVKDGYGRNYLLPQGLAVLATEKAVKQHNEELKQRAHKIAKIKADAEARAKQFEGVSLVIKARVSEGRNIYGSVGPKEIAAALAEKGLEIDSKLISIKGVKTLGNYEAIAQFHREVTVAIPFEVVNEDGTPTDKFFDYEITKATEEAAAVAEEAAPAEETPAEEAEAPAETAE